MDKLIHAVQKDVAHDNKRKAKKDLKVLLKADKKFDRKIAMCDKSMHKKKRGHREG